MANKLKLFIFFVLSAAFSPFACHPQHEAPIELKTAEQLFRHSDKTDSIEIAQNFITIGQMYLFLDKIEESSHYFQKGLELANAIEDSSLQNILLQKISDNYTRMQEYEKAENALRLALNINGDRKNTPQYYLRIVNLFLTTNRLDSLDYYVDKLKDEIEVSDDLYFKADAYALLANRARAKDDFYNALSYLQKQNRLTEDIAKKHLEQSIYEVRQKYDYERGMSKYRQQITIYQCWTIAILVLLLAAGFVIVKMIFHHKNKQLAIHTEIDTLKNMLQEQANTYKDGISRKEEELQEMHLAMASWQQKDKDFSNYKRERIRKRGEFLRALVLYQLDLKDKMKEWEKLNKNLGSDALSKKLSEILYNSKNGDKWVQIEAIFERVNDPAPQKLRMRYPNLNETEYKVALLSYSGLTADEIAVAISLEPRTVRNNRTNLRKKVGISAKAIDTGTYLRENLL